jgi:hypothetical protein
MEVESKVRLKASREKRKYELREGREEEGERQWR